MVGSVKEIPRAAVLLPLLKVSGVSINVVAFDRVGMTLFVGLMVVPLPVPVVFVRDGAAAVSVTVSDCEVPEIVIPVTVKVTGPFPMTGGTHPAAQDTVKFHVEPPGASCVLSANCMMKLPEEFRPTGCDGGV